MNFPHPVLVRSRSGQGNPRRGSIWVTLALGLVAAGCGNMKHQPNLHEDDASQHFHDGTASRPTPAHTVARGATSRLTADAFDNDTLENITNLPVPLTHELLVRGQQRFEIYCAVCHGSDGYGTGIVAQRGFPRPPSLHDERLRNAPIGHFVNVMTRGYGMMYPYRDRVTEADRWAIAAYVRALQRSQHATLADVPPERLAALSTPSAP